MAGRASGMIKRDELLEWLSPLALLAWPADLIDSRLEAPASVCSPSDSAILLTRFDSDLLLQLLSPMTLSGFPKLTQRFTRGSIASCLVLTILLICIGVSLTHLVSSPVRAVPKMHFFHHHKKSEAPGNEAPGAGAPPPPLPPHPPTYSSFSDSVPPPVPEATRPGHSSASPGPPPIPPAFSPAAPPIPPHPVGGYNSSRLDQKISQPSQALPGQKYRSVLYFCNWSIYARKHFPQQLPIDHLTHVLYAFAKINGQTGEVTLSDEWADIQCSAAPTPQIRGLGCFGEFYKLKQQHPHLRLLLSIGGWTYSTDLANGVSTPEGRATFVRSSVALLHNLALDGLDIDWEYPNNDDEAGIYVELLRDVRAELDAEADRQGVAHDQFDLTVAAPAGPEQVSKLRIEQMDPYLSFWNLMTYDFTGPWAPQVGHQSNLYNGDISVDNTVGMYMSVGVPPSKLVLGMPMYGRAFANTEGLGASYEGTVPGTWEQGVFDYRTLPGDGFVEQVDAESVGAYCYNATQKVLISYDNPDTVRAKADYVARRGLGGGMWWESSGDFPIEHPRSLIGAFVNKLAPENLARAPSNNMNMPQEMRNQLKLYNGTAPANSTNSTNTR